MNHRSHNQRTLQNGMIGGGGGFTITGEGTENSRFLRKTYIFFCIYSKIFVLTIITILQELINGGMEYECGAGNALKN